MEHCRVAERALVAALVMGQVDPADLSGRLHPLDFTDPAAAACFAAALDHRSSGTPMVDLPDRLRRQAQLRSDGYPIRELVDWIPSLPVPAHLEAWAALVVAGSMGRVVNACGTRLVQSTSGHDGARVEAGRVLTVAAAQRATLHGALRRWEALPASWRDTVPVHEAALPAVSGACPAESGAGMFEREVLAGVIAAPVLLDRIPWLTPEDFTQPEVAAVFEVARQLHVACRPVDLVTLSASINASEASRSTGSSETGACPAAVLADLRPEQAMLATVPFLARRLVEDTTVRQARAAGESLMAGAGAPGSTGGVGRSLLVAALDRLDDLRPHAERLEQAHRPAISRAEHLARRDPARVPTPRRTFGAGRHAS